MNRTPTIDPARLQAAITDMDSLSQTAFNQITAITTLVLAYLETVNGQADTETTARALECVKYLSTTAVENIGYEADYVDCGWVDAEHERRIKAVNTTDITLNKEALA